MKKISMETNSMKTLIFGAGPIGRWLALGLHKAGKNVTLLARNETYGLIKNNGIVLVDGHTNEKRIAKVKVTDKLNPEDQYELIVVAMRKSSRVAVCPILAQNEHLKNVLFLGNDVSGFHQYIEYLPKEKVLLGFPGAGGGYDGDDLVFVDTEKPNGKKASIYIGELDGKVRERTKQIKEFFESAGQPTRIENDIDGWLKYHFAFMGPTAGIVFKCELDLHAVAADREGISKYVLACREAGNVLRRIGYTKRQPFIFNIYYWLPKWLAPKVFKKLFTSRHAEVGIGLHARAIGSELYEMVEEFAELKAKAGIETRNLDDLLAYIPHE